MLVLPEGMPRELLEHLKKVRVGGQMLRMRRAEDADKGAPAGPRKFAPRPRPRPPGARGPGGPRRKP